MDPATTRQKPGVLAPRRRMDADSCVELPVVGAQVVWAVVAADVLAPLLPETTVRPSSPRGPRARARARTRSRALTARFSRSLVETTCGKRQDGCRIMACGKRRAGDAAISGVVGMSQAAGGGAGPFGVAERAITALSAASVPLALAAYLDNDEAIGSGRRGKPRRPLPAEACGPGYLRTRPASMAPSLRSSERRASASLNDVMSTIEATSAAEPSAMR